MGLKYCLVQVDFHAFETREEEEEGQEDTRSEASAKQLDQKTDPDTIPAALPAATTASNESESASASSSGSSGAEIIEKLVIDAPDKAGALPLGFEEDLVLGAAWEDVPDPGPLQGKGLLIFRVYSYSYQPLY